MLPLARLHRVMEGVERVVLFDTRWNGTYCMLPSASFVSQGRYL